MKTLILALLLAAPAFALDRFSTGSLTAGVPQFCMPITDGEATATVRLSGTWTGTVTWRVVPRGALAASAVTTWAADISTRTAAQTATANGNYAVPIAGFGQACAKFTTATSGTVVVGIDMSPAAFPDVLANFNLGVGGSAAASTATTYAMTGTVVAQRPTTTATAPANTTLTAATATKVFASAAGICQVACQNIDAAIHVKCGQTSAVSATVGLDVVPGNTYVTSQGYGGDVYCFPASGTPAVSCQPTACP